MSEIQGRNGIQKILVFPRGKFYIEKYDDWITFDDLFFSQIIEAYECETLRKPFIDKNHELEESYGDLSNPSVEDDGMYFECVLNESGIELIQNRIYTSISPTFGELTDTTGKRWNNCLISVSLTNIPALQNNYPDLQSQFELSMKNGWRFFNMVELKTEVKPMRNLEIILKKLELSPEASDMAIAEAIQKLMDEGATQEQLIASLQKKIDEMNAMVETAVAEKDAAVSEVAEMKAEADKKEFETLFTDALTGGVIIPADKDEYFSLYRLNKKLAVNQMKKLSAKKENGFTLSNDVNLSDEDRIVMKSIGMDVNDPKEVKFYLDSQK